MTKKVVSFLEEKIGWQHHFAAPGDTNPSDATEHADSYRSRNISCSQFRQRSLSNDDETNSGVTRGQRGGGEERTAPGDTIRDGYVTPEWNYFLRIADEFGKTTGETTLEGGEGVSGDRRDDR